MKTKLIVFAAALLAAFAPAARADWSDDFSGGTFNQPWVFLDDGGSIPPNATLLDPSSNELIVEGDAIAALGGTVDQFAVGVVGLANPAPYLFTDVRTSATVRSFPHLNLAGGITQGNNDAFVFVRVQGPPTLASYLLSLDFANGAVDLVHVVNPATLLGLDDATIAGFDPTATYRLELTAIGTQLTGNVYSSTDALLATVSATDGSLTAGLSGVGAALNSDLPQPQITLMSVVFDDVSSRAIPEPTTFALAGCAAALLGAAAIRRRRRS
jgi:hypothetical protein